jgi:hypothetical protein
MSKFLASAALVAAVLASAGGSSSAVAVSNAGAATATRVTGRAAPGGAALYAFRRCPGCCVIHCTTTVAAG